MVGVIKEAGIRGRLAGQYGAVVFMGQCADGNFHYRVINTASLVRPYHVVVAMLTGNIGRLVLRRGLSKNEPRIFKVFDVNFFGQNDDKIGKPA